MHARELIELRGLRNKQTLPAAVGIPSRPRSAANWRWAVLASQSRSREPWQVNCFVMGDRVRFAICDLRQWDGVPCDGGLILANAETWVDRECLAGQD